MHRLNIIKLIGTFITSLAFAIYLLLFADFLKVYLNFYHFLSAFLITFSGYYYLRFTKDNDLNKYSVFSLFLLALAIYLKLFSQHFQITHYFIILLFTLIVLYIYHSQRFVGVLRGSTFFKPFIISFVWLIILFWYTKKFHALFYLHQFTFIALLTIPFDVQTVHSDNFMTIPKKFGISKTQKILIFFTLIYITLSYFVSSTLFYTSLVTGCGLMVLYFIPLTFYNLLVYVCYDGIIILQTLIYYLLEKYLTGCG